MRYILIVIRATYNTNNTTDELTFDNFYDMQGYIMNNSEQWVSYRIEVK